MLAPQSKIGSGLQRCSLRGGLMHDGKAGVLGFGMKQYIIVRRHDAWT